MKRILIALAAVATLLLAVAAPAAAQGQTVSAEPANVESGGEHTFTITGEGFTGDAFLLPCPGAEGNPANVAEDGACDLGSLTPVSPDDDGNISVEWTIEVPDEGLVFVIGNAAQTEVGANVITVGAMAEAMEDEAMEEGEAMDDALADTGLESAQLVIIGGAVLVAGLMFARSRRELLV